MAIESEEQNQADLRPSSAIGLGEQQSAIRGLAGQARGEHPAIFSFGDEEMPAISQMPAVVQAPQQQAIPQAPAVEDPAFKPVDWANSVPVREMQIADPDAFDNAQKFLRSEGVLDEQGRTSPVKMGYLFEKASTNPELFQKLVDPQIQMATTKTDKAYLAYDKIARKLEKDHNYLEAKMQMGKMEKVYSKVNGERNNLLAGVYEAKQNVEKAQKKQKTKLAIGQFLLENEDEVRSLPPVEQNYLKTLFATGDIEGFSKFMGEHANISDAHNARTQR